MIVILNYLNIILFRFSILIENQKTKSFLKELLFNDEKNEKHFSKIINTLFDIYSEGLLKSNGVLPDDIYQLYYYDKKTEITYLEGERILDSSYDSIISKEERRIRKLNACLRLYGYINFFGDFTEEFKCRIKKQIDIAIANKTKKNTKNLQSNWIEVTVVLSDADKSILSDKILPIIGQKFELTISSAVIKPPLAPNQSKIRIERFFFLILIYFIKHTGGHTDHSSFPYLAYTVIIDLENRGIGKYI